MEKNFKKSLICMALLFVCVLATGLTAPVSGALYGSFCALSFVSLASALYFWFRFAAPLMAAN